MHTVANSLVTNPRTHLSRTHELICHEPTNSLVTALNPFGGQAKALEDLPKVVLQEDEGEWHVVSGML